LIACETKPISAHGNRLFFGRLANWRAAKAYSRQLENDQPAATAMNISAILGGHSETASKAMRALPKNAAKCSIH
jgi:hypothetical protein